MNELVGQLLRVPRASVVAAAGCGKTELIARVVAADPGQRHLVLTHTHAGVHALRDRLRRFDVTGERAAVSTVAAFALRLASALPATSELPTTTPTSDDEWRAVQRSAGRLPEVRAVAEMLRASYSSVLVDEYQDCTTTQHDLVRAIAQVLPVRVFGDPLQGIFNFAGDIINWRRDVDPCFERLAELEVPYRWQDVNPALGAWLTGARHALLSGRPLPDDGGVVMRGPAERPQQLDICRRRAREDAGRVVAIHGQPPQAHAFAQQLQGQYSSIEEMACESLMRTAATLDAAQEYERPVALLDFLANAASNVSRYLRSARRRYEQGQPATARDNSPHKRAVDVLNTVACSSAPGHAVRAIDSILQLPEVRPYRRELLNEMRRALRYQADNPECSLQEAAWHARDLTRRMGRRLPRLTVGRTFLVKGLEFDHAVVLDASALRTPQQVYVALTRGARSLALLGEVRRFRPANGRPHGQVDVD